jgi:hypothetical protein
MKPIYTLITAIVLFTSCSRITKNFLAHADQDKTIFDAIKQLNKKPNDTNAIKAIPILYTQAQDRNLTKINTYKSSTAITRWDKIYDTYNDLQKMYEAITNSDAASKLVTPFSYQQQLNDTKQAAAEDYYQQGLILLDKNNREDTKVAYSYFNKANKWMPDYKNTKELIAQAFNDAIINVVINPVADNSFFFSSGWNNGSTYSNEYFQQNLVRELGGTNTSRYPARFYTDWDARSNNVQADWVVDLTLRNMDIPRPTTRYYSRNASQSVETGKDSSGHSIYKTVYATINITSQSFTARGEMEVRITDINTRKLILVNSYSDSYNWQEEYATYTGDNRALSNADWNLTANDHFVQPTKEEIMRELYRNIYPQVKNRIIYAVDW